MWFFRRSTQESKAEADKIARRRSLPSAHHFRFAVTLSAIHFLCLIAMLTTAVLLAMHPTYWTSTVLIATMVATGATWFIALLKRRTTLCPLCRGTPLLESGARLHERARRIFPFPHGVSSVLSILFLQRFRCMYCGSDYDLLKDPKRHRTRQKE
jgi:hypothetical protein